MMFFGNARVMGNILCCGLLDRFPDLKFVSVESGIGWVPFLLEALDYQLMENFPNFGRYMQLKPSEYFARNFAACFWFENRNLANSVRAVGVDNVMFETDFPHPTCIYPESADHIRSGLATLNWEERHKILSGNAARLYNIPL
jgi:predicted TIM-barrel fold metal-dependent hydrolase